MSFEEMSFEQMISRKSKDMEKMQVNEKYAKEYERKFFSLPSF